MNPKQINYIRQQHAKYPAQYMIGETVPKSQEQIRIEGLFPEAFEPERKHMTLDIEWDQSDEHLEELTAVDFWNAIVSVYKDRNIIIRA